MRDGVFGPEHLLWALSSNFWCACAVSIDDSRAQVCGTVFCAVLFVSGFGDHCRQTAQTSACCFLSGWRSQPVTCEWCLVVGLSWVHRLGAGDAESLRIPFRKLSWLCTYSPCSCVHWLDSCTRVLQVATQMSIDCIVGSHFLITELVAGPVRS